MRFHANQLVAQLVVDNVEMMAAIADPPDDEREHQGTNAAILFLRKVLYTNRVLDYICGLSYPYMAPDCDQV
ncbi:hypothetical protein CHS0354_015644 [Potamilus streckersoni]|uniref:Uncharacterized protein n=1 Tax=Potamilus streckersoni TaxID=2493646 RepID=A0AAE0VV91_9BIVA|nr:hypothetical protein CHS0354_015644 [Potamilus streckersoni]